MHLEHTHETKAKKHKHATLGHLEDVDVDMKLDDIQMDFDVLCNWASGSSGQPPLPPLAPDGGITPRAIMPPPTPTFPTSHQSPAPITFTSTSKENEVPHGPTTAPAKDERMDEAYETQMTSLIVNIHKTNYEWNKRARELNIAAAKLKSHAMCADSEVLKTLTKNLQQGQQWDKMLQSIEEKHALGQYVETKDQTMAKHYMNLIMTTIKECLRMKLPDSVNEKTRRLCIKAFIVCNSCQHAYDVCSDSLI